MKTRETPTAVAQIADIFYKLPLDVQHDINTRVSDWLSSGGGDNDAYIYQQLRYAQNVLRRMEGEVK